jgi:hypothetical protein
MIDIMKGPTFWDITQCSALKVNCSACYLLGLFFDPEDGDNIFLQNVGRLSTNYTVLYPRRQNSSWHAVILKVMLCHGSGG